MAKQLVGFKDLAWYLKLLVIVGGLGVLYFIWVLLLAGVGVSLFS